MRNAMRYASLQWFVVTMFLLGLTFALSASAQTQEWNTFTNLAVPCPDTGCLASGPGCDTKAVAGQCSFPKENAQTLCAAHPQCNAVTCNGDRNHCQARKVTALQVWKGFTSHVLKWNTFTGQAVHCPDAGCLITSGPGCDIKAAAGQCSFPKEKAQTLCAAHPQCNAVTCNGDRNDCQARKATTIKVSKGFTSHLIKIPTQ